MQWVDELANLGEKELAFISFSWGWRPTARTPHCAGSGGWEHPAHCRVHIQAWCERAAEGSSCNELHLSNSRWYSTSSSPKPLTIGSHKITSINTFRKATLGLESCWRFQGGLIKKFSFNKKQIQVHVQIQMQIKTRNKLKNICYSHTFKS